MLIKQFMSTPVEFLPGIVQTATPQSEWPYAPDWIVSHVAHDTGLGVYWISGRLASGEPFHWSHYAADCVFYWRYDLTGATYSIGRHETLREAQAREEKERRAERERISA